MSKNQELEELYNTISQIYLKNINYFSKNHNKIYKKIQEFEKLNIENFFLEFENNHFELKDSNGQNIYNCDPFFDAQKRSININEKISLSLVKDTTIMESPHYKNSINAYEFINEYIQFPNTKYTLNKFIFLGTLLGVHIQDLSEKLKSKAYLIIEDNLEVFRLSMFLTDYEHISKTSKLFFCINENINSTKTIIRDFLNYKYKFNNHIGLELSNEKVIPYIDTLTKEFINYDPLSYPFSEYLISLERAIYYQKESTYGLLKLNDLNKTSINKPILFLGAGPSLGNNIKWLEKSKDNFVIICVAACLKRLESINLKPDIIITIDGQKEVVKDQFNVREEIYKESIVLSSIKTDKGIIHLLTNDNTFFSQDNLGFFDNHKVFTGLTVGDIGLDLILSFGAKEIYMLGFDASIDEKGKTHDDIYRTSTLDLKESNIIENAGFNTKEDLVKVKGNFKDEVFTLMLYKQMIESIENILENKKVNIYNLSNGAYFKYTTPLRIEDIKLKDNLDKHTFKIQLKEILISLSTKNLSSIDKSFIKREKKILKKLQSFKIENYYTSFVKTKNSYESSILLQIIEQFFKLIMPYANTKEKEEIMYLQYIQILKKLNEIYNS